MAITKKWFGSDCVATDELRGEALWLEKQYWERTEIAINNGINKAFT